MRNTSILLMFITILTKCFGLAREKALAHFFGTSPMASIFLIAFSLPMVLANLFSGSIASGYIPIYNGVSDREGEESAYKFTSNLANIVAILAIIISFLAILFAENLVQTLSPGFNGDVFTKAVYMSRITSISILATAVASIYKAYLQVKNHFLISMFHSVLMNVILIITMYLGRDQNITVLAIGILLAFLLQYVIFIPFIAKSGYRYTLEWNPNNVHMKSLLVLIFPILISTSVMELNLIINKAIASQVSLSGISIINYATKIQGFITGIVVTSIITVTYPQMSRLAEREDKTKLGKVFGESISLMSLLVIPASLGLIVFADEIVRLLFLGGAFGEKDVLETGRVLMFYGVGLLGIGVREIGIRIFYSCKQTRAPIWNSVFMVSTNILLSFILSRRLGLIGLAIGTSASLVLGAIGILFAIRKILPSLGLREKAFNLAKIIFSSLVMVIVAKGLNIILLHYFSSNLSLLLSILLAGFIYLSEIYIFNIEELSDLKRLSRKK